MIKLGDEVFDHEDEEYLYGIRIMIEHPTLDPDEISIWMNVEPDHILRPVEGKSGGSKWILSSQTVGERFFFKEMEEIIDWLEEKSGVLEKIISSGGEILVVANLAGQFNIGDEIGSDVLGKAAKLGLSIGVEVFPGMKKR